MISGHVCMGPVEFLATAALPLAAASGLLRDYLRQRFGVDETEKKGN